MAHDPYEYLHEPSEFCCAGAEPECFNHCVMTSPGGYDATDHLTTLLSARESRYGSFDDNAEVSQELKSAIRYGTRYGACYSDQKEALDMIAAKISRIVTGDPDYIDNWDDIAGYAKLVADRLRRDQQGTPEGAR